MSRIAFISALDSVPWGGSEELWSRAAGVLRTRGHEVFANTHWWPEKAAPLIALENAGVLLTRRRLRERSKLLDQTLTRGKLGAKIFHWLDETAPETVVLSLESQSAGAAWMDECRKRNLPYALIVQAVNEQLWPGDATNETLSRGYQNARKIFCVSRGNLAWLQTQFAHDLPQAEIVCNPFNVAFDAAPRWPQDGSTLRLACVGRLDPVAKGHDLLFNVLAQQKWRARDLQLSIFGNGGYEKSLRNLQNYLQLSSVKFEEFSSDIEKIWSENHALVLPSRFEGMPLVVLEAMLCGRASLVTDVAGNAELLQDNVSGFVAAAPKIECVDEALERLWQSWKNGELQNIGQRAARAVRAKIPRDPALNFAAKIEAIL